MNVAGHKDRSVYRDRPAELFGPKRWMKLKTPARVPTLRELPSVCGVILTRKMLGTRHFDAFRHLNWIQLYGFGTLDEVGRNVGR
jgi:hypothetical protein